MPYLKEMNYIIELLRCAVTDQIPSLPPDGIDWDRVFFYARKHKIISTLYFGMQKLPKDIQKDIKYFDKYVLNYKEILVRDANRTYESERITQDFEQNNIDYILLKGSVTKHLYPDTSMRVMSDVDILYRNSNFNQLDKIFREHGFERYKKEPKEVSYLKPELKIKIEMQTQLVDEGYELWFDYLSNIWEKCTKQPDSCRYHMTKEDFYIYHIIHMAKHFINGGIGLVHILDTKIILDAYRDMNWDYLNEQFEQVHLKTFQKYVKLLSAMWFGAYTPSKEELYTLEMMGEYIFANGAFGRQMQKEVNQIAARKNTHASIIRKIFPDKNTLADYYGSVPKKYPFLIPLYWIRLNMKRLFFDRKSIGKHLKTMNNITVHHIETTKDLMTRLGLNK